MISKFTKKFFFSIALLFVMQNAKVVAESIAEESIEASCAEGLDSGFIKPTVAHLAFILMNFGNDRTDLQDSDLDSIIRLFQARGCDICQKFNAKDMFCNFNSDSEDDQSMNLAAMIEVQHGSDALAELYAKNKNISMLYFFSVTSISAQIVKSLLRHMPDVLSDVAKILDMLGANYRMNYKKASIGQMMLSDCDEQQLLLEEQLSEAELKEIEFYTDSDEKVEDCLISFYHVQEIQQIIPLLYAKLNDQNKQKEFLQKYPECAAIIA